MISVSNIYLCLFVSLSIYLSIYLPTYLYIYNIYMYVYGTQLSAHIDILCVSTIITVCRYLFCSICPGGVIFSWATCRCGPVEGVTVGWPCWLSAAKGLSPRGFGGPCVEFTLRGLVWKLGKGPGSPNWPYMLASMRLEILPFVFLKHFKVWAANSTLADKRAIWDPQFWASFGSRTCSQLLHGHKLGYPWIFLIAGQHRSVLELFLIFSNYLSSEWLVYKYIGGAFSPWFYPLRNSFLDKPIGWWWNIGVKWV